jgi:hypothetical protein
MQIFFTPIIDGNESIANQPPFTMHVRNSSGK